LAKFKNLTIGFDLDGLADTHSIYRRNTDWNLVIKNANNFIRAGGNATWRMIVFEHNKHQIADCKELSKKMGFKNFQIINDGRDNGPVYDKQGKFSYSVGKKTIDYPDDVFIWKSWTSYNQQNQIWPIEPVSKNKNCHTKNQKEIYITATGEVYPCCFLGFYPNSRFQREHYGDDALLKEIVNNNNANQVGIRKAIEYFTEIESAWEKDLYNQGRLFTCDHYCGQKQ